ncbi:dienelactone hydrolase [Mycobacterium sp. CBMA 234]|uniref:dienelactone hydrolase family protein n=1 Tax=Mycolicibacterium sp. CBMA 234 TaxID=1918495 RepID=UPI0012DC7A29|nr:dienelactone hydrolase family protein [Mycolicibacterium sp. CBMA 234]MUL67260.1 dienelactone hydrolase [Mycolicibacterium sp. CBMA 234]
MPVAKDVIPTNDGSCDVTIATPEGTGPWPAVVMYPDAGGPRQTFDDMAARLAALGYVVLVPDIYYRDAGWAPFDMATAFSDETERTRLFGLMRKVTPDIMTADATAFFDYLAARPEVKGDTFGTTGYCMGGRTSVVVAGQLPDRVAAAMSFHGGGLVTDAEDSPHRSADKMRAVVYVGAAENDGSFTAEQGEILDRALTDAGVEHTVEFYPAAHGFAVPDNAGAYDEAAAQRHWDAMERVFGAALN